jgi:hypothetical protein
VVKCSCRKGCSFGGVSRQRGRIFQGAVLDCGLDRCGGSLLLHLQEKGC